MKRTAAILTLLCVAAAGYSQRNYVGLSFGSSLPGEEFAKKSILENGGYALSGFVVEFAGAYIFDYYLGVAGTLTFSSNGVDRAALGDEIENNVPGVPPADVDINMKVGNWLYANVMVGPMLAVPAWKFTFDVRAVAGLSFMMSPPWELTVITPDDEFLWVRNNNTVNFAYMLGAGIRFAINEAYSIRLSSDYFRSKPSFETDDQSLAGAITGDDIYNMDIGTLHINIGLAYRF